MSNISKINVGGTEYDISGISMIAPIESTQTASHNYAVGEQFVYQGLLYKATQQITIGDTITVGANCELADEVTKQIGEINSNLSWTQIGNTYVWADSFGHTPISIPANAKEVLVSGVYGGLQVNKIIAPITFPSGTVELVDGYYASSTDNGSWTITVSQGAIGLREFNYNGANVGASVTAKVYYR